MEAFESFIISVTLSTTAIVFTMLVIRAVFEVGKALIVGRQE